MTQNRLGGFTLIEVMVGVVLMGLVLLVAQRSFEVVRAYSDRLHREDSVRVLPALQDGFFRSAFASADLSTEGSAFSGQEHQVSISTWIESPDGWPERVRLSLGWSNGVVTASGAPWGPMALAPTDRPPRYHYLAEDGRWLDGWESPVETPKAIRMIRASLGQSDTALFLVGGRR
jgi:prepilin-type N-terminal cleavage/methylation domain-containing protein